MTELQQGIRIKERYVLKDFKGSGSFGEVWLAYDEFLEIEVAIKLYISLDARGVEEFKTEYKTAYGLNHPNLLAATYFDVWQQRPFLVMKYCPNGSVGNIAGNTSERKIWQFIHDVAAGLAFLHEQEPEPIIHQDIKPDNILIDEKGRFLITDFGISKRVRSTMRKQSKRGAEAGATAYMGPERFSKDPTPIMASDIWSLGASIYELATGELPFCGMGGGMQMQGAELPELDKAWSNGLNFVMQSCLAKDPWNRPTAKLVVDYSSIVLEGREPGLTWAEDKGDKGGVSGDGDENSGDNCKDSKNTNSKSQLNKHVIRNLGIGLILIMTAAVYFMSFGKSPLEKEAEATWAEYVNQVKSCQILISQGGNDNVKPLLDAREAISSIKSLEDKYAQVNPEYNDYSWLKSVLDGKLNTAHVAWVRAAEAQYEKVKDVSKAVEYYQLALKLKDDPDTKSTYLNLAKKIGYMIIKDIEFRNVGDGTEIISDYGSTLYASNLKYLSARIIYDGLDNTAITLYVKIITPYGNLHTGSTSPSNYSFKNDNIYVLKGENNKEELTGWGNKTVGSYTSGTYRYEIWYNNRKLFSKEVVIH